MVSFSCEVCNDTIQKKKLDQHKQKCPEAYYTCLDCGVTFEDQQYRQHVSCITESEKYEKSARKPRKQQGGAQLTSAKTSPLKPAKTSSLKPAKAAPSVPSKTPEEIQVGKFLQPNKQTSLYKVIKKISRDTGTHRKQLQKQIKVTLKEDGTIQLLE